MSKKERFNKKRITNPDFRHRTDFPLPPIEEIEKRLIAVLTPGAFAPRRMADQKNKLRERILTLPVMVAIVVSLVWRKIPSLTEVLRILQIEGLLWVEAMTVSKQALSKRLEKLPAKLFAYLFEDVISIIQKEKESESESKSESKDLELAVGSIGSIGQESWKWDKVKKIKAHFTAIWIADGSTLEALRKKLKEAPKEIFALGGKMMVIVEAFRHTPIAAFYSEEPQVNDKSFSDKLLEKLPMGGLLIFDLGFFSFLWFDRFNQAKKFFVSRLREKTSYKTIKVLSEGPRYRDSIIKLGLYRANPCHYEVRMVEVLWNTNWYRYITNVLDPEILSAKEVCELYRRRWRIEDAFLLTKRLLCLCYLWVGKSNGIEIQIYATLIFYAVLNDICQQVALALNVPLERISVEMVFRGFYHFSRAYQSGKSENIVLFLVQNAAVLSLIKAEGKRHRQAKIQQQQIWGDLLS